jgi:hypothetical protein
MAMTKVSLKDINFRSMPNTAEQLDSLAKSKSFLITDHYGIKKYPVSKLTDNFFLLISKVKD